jgi:hypothetical protein
MATTPQGTDVAAAVAGSVDSTETVVGRHIQAFFGGDIEAIMADFANDALICTPEGAIRGRSAIRAFFEHVLPGFPPGATKVDVKQQIVDGELLYAVWTSSSPKLDVPFACDVFVVRDGKLVYQCFAGQLLPNPA